MIGNRTRASLLRSRAGTRRRSAAGARFQDGARSGMQSDLSWRSISQRVARRGTRYTGGLEVRTVMVPGLEQSERGGGDCAGGAGDEAPRGIDGEAREAV